MSSELQEEQCLRNSDLEGAEDRAGSCVSFYGSHQCVSKASAMAEWWGYTNTIQGPLEHHWIPLAS
jgi:hypothetical protein